MKTRISISKSSSPQSFSIKALVAAIAASGILSYEVNAAPTGGAVVGGTGSINQIGSTTQVQQTSNRLAVQWNSFNVAASESVKFVQPNKSAIALNRILDNNASQILGKIDANGHVILMNPNGILFGTSAQVNVGGLIASGLNIKTSDFMSGDLKFSGVEGTSGSVTNSGVIKAAAGGNVLLLGKNVSNNLLISADLGHVALASGNEAVVTFDDDGLIGVRIDQETLASDVAAYAVNNSGMVSAKGGKILLNASASADLFSEAVNRGSLNGSTEVVLHEDGSFSLGGGNDVINSGALSVSASGPGGHDAGYVIVAGKNVEQRGVIQANASGANLAGEIYVEASDKVWMRNASSITATAGVISGIVSLDSDKIQSEAAATITTTGNTYATGYLEAGLPNIDTHHLYVSSLDTLTQSAPAVVSGNTHITTAAGGDIQLNNSDNDFNTVSIRTYFNDNVSITDRNDIVLGNIEMEDSSLSVQALGEDATISQLGDSNLFLSAGHLRLEADNVILGEDGSTSDLTGVAFNVDFTKSVATNESVTLHPYMGMEGSNVVHFIGKTREYGDVLLDLKGGDQIELNATFEDGEHLLVIDRMLGRTAELYGASLETYQTGPVTLSESLTWNSYITELTNPQNDIASIKGNGGPAFGSLNYVDKNDLVIDDLITGSEVSVSLASVGSGGTLSQAANTTLQADFLSLSANNISLGAGGTSEIVGGSVMDINFSGDLEIDGPWSVSSYALQGPFVNIIGTNSSNRLRFGPNAVNNSFANAGYFARLNIDLKGGADVAIFDSEFPIGGADPEVWDLIQLNMGSGNDRVEYNSNVQIPLLLGAGRDTLTLLNGTIEYDVLDFNPAEDTLVGL